MNPPKAREKLKRKTRGTCLDLYLLVLLDINVNITQLPLKRLSLGQVRGVECMKSYLGLFPLDL